MGRGQGKEPAKKYRARTPRDHGSDGALVAVPHGACRPQTLVWLAGLSLQILGQKKIGQIAGETWQY